MGLKSTKILEISITTSSKEEILEETKKYLDSARKTPFVIVTPNPEQVVYARRDAHFAQILNQADIAIPDGIGLIWASRVLSAQHINQRIPGVEFMEDLVAIAAKRTHRIGLIGGLGGVAVKALECLQKKYPGLVGWAIEPEHIKLNQLPQADIIFVGLGSPKQEYFIERIRYQVSGIRQEKKNLTYDALTLDPPLVLMSVGGSFDILAKNIPRSPARVRNAGFEWVWRLILEPRRWRRQIALVRFFLLVLSDFFRV